MRMTPATPMTAPIAARRPGLSPSTSTERGMMRRGVVEVMLNTTAVGADERAH